MKKIVLGIFLLINALLVTAQVKNPASFSYKAIKKTADTYEVVITATLEKDWHIYSQKTEPGGPLPTKLNFTPNPLIKLNGKPEEKGKLQKTFDKTFGVNVLYYSNEVNFVQTIKVKAGVQTNIKGYIEYMLCNDEMCLPPKKQNFDIKI